MNGRIATLMVHTSPLEQAGIGDAGGMNIYVAESARRMAAMGVNVDIFTRRVNPDLPDIVEFSPSVQVHHLGSGLADGITKERLPELIPTLSEEFKVALQKERYDLIHSHYWISGKVALGAMSPGNAALPLVHTMHTMARVKNLNLAEGETPEPPIRVQGETQIVAAASGLIANTDAEAASLVSLYQACPDIVHVVSPGVDLSNFTPGARENERLVKI
jgi:D-inositol-3-phosphate glycosyltransferase